MKGNTAVAVLVIIMLAGALAGAGYMTWRMQRELRDIETEHDELAAEQKKLSASYSSEKQKALSLQRLLDSVTEKLERALTEVEQKAAQNAVLRKENEIVQDEHNKLQHETSRLQKQTEKQRAVISQKAAEVSQLHKKNSALEKRSKEQKKKLSEAQVKIKSLTSRVAALEKKAADAAAHAGKRKQELIRLNAERAVWRGVLLYESGKYEDAEAEFKAAVESDPANREAFRGLALCYEALGQKEDARAWWKNYIRTGPEEEKYREAREHFDALGD